MGSGAAWVSRACALAGLFACSAAPEEAPAEPVPVVSEPVGGEAPLAAIAGEPVVTAPLAVEVPTGTGSGRGGITAGLGVRVPTVRPEKADIAGALDREILRRIVRTHMSEVSRCYHEGLQRDVDLMGRAVFAFQVDRIGRVLAPGVAESTLADAEVSACVVAAIKGWRFPADSAGVVDVRLPFRFEPG